MKVLNRSYKALMWEEAVYIYMLRGKTNKSLDELAVDEDFLTDGEFDDICKDLRSFRRVNNYQLIQISVEEYELCCDMFGCKNDYFIVD